MMQFWNTPLLSITLDDQPIPDVESTKFLGVYLDNKLTWDMHVDAIYGKLTVNRHLLRMAKNMLSPRCLKIIYYAHIQSHLNYGLLIWGSMISKQKLQKLTSMQNSCIHLLSK